MFIEDDNYVAEGLARLLTQYQNSPDLQAILSAFLEQIQTIEIALTGMNTLRYLPNAVGVQLDNIGEIVGIVRPAGASDAQYLLDIYGQIKINTSQGQPEQVIQTFLLFTGASQVRLFEFPPGDVLLESSYNPPSLMAFESIINIINEVLPAGCRSIGLVVYDPVTPFTYSETSMLPATGYGSTGTPGVGGKYGTLKRPFNGPFGYAGDNSIIKGYGSRRDPIIGGAYAG